MPEVPVALSRFLPLCPLLSSGKRSVLVAAVLLSMP